MVGHYCGAKAAGVAAADFNKLIAIKPTDRVAHIVTKTTKSIRRLWGLSPNTLLIIGDSWRRDATCWGA